MKELLPLLLSCAACADPVGVTLQFVPDPNLASADDLAATVSSIELVADSDIGLYPAGAARVEGAVRIEDADDDPSSLELVATIEVGGHLPIVRIERGSLPDMALDLTFTGREAEGGTAAVGGVRGVSLGDGDGPLLVPFNPPPSALPPRVVEVIPSSSDIAPDCSIPIVVVMFSRPIEIASVLSGGAFEIEPDPGPFDIAADVSGRVVRLLLESPLSGTDGVVRYRLRVRSSVVDLQGTALDQAPAESAEQPFDVAFEVACNGVPPPGLPQNPCGSGLDMATTCPGAQRLECIDGFCVPARCDDARCEVGAVCSTESGLCEADCRTYAPVDVCEEDLRCDESTGECTSP